MSNTRPTTVRMLLRAMFKNVIKRDSDVLGIQRIRTREKVSAVKRSNEFGKCGHFCREQTKSRRSSTIKKRRERRSVTKYAICTILTPRLMYMRQRTDHFSVSKEIKTFSITTDKPVRKRAYYRVLPSVSVDYCHETI